MRSAKIFYKNVYAGILQESDEGYVFIYDEEYLNNEDSEPISLTLPLSNKTYFSNVLFPFFDGLIPEGWLLNIAIDKFQYKENDRMSILLSCCSDCIGAVSVVLDKKEVL